MTPAERERLRALITEKESYEGALDRREIDGLMLADDQRLLSYHNGACSRLANAVPSLLAEVDALTAQLAALREAGRKVVEAHGQMDVLPDGDCICQNPEWDAFAALLDARTEER